MSVTHLCNKNCPTKGERKVNIERERRGEGVTDYREKIVKTKLKKLDSIISADQDILVPYANNNNN